MLQTRLKQISDEFNFLVQENKRLKNELNKIQDENDLLIRNNEDCILAINNTLNKFEANKDE
jgi:phage-related tail protein